MNHDHTFTVKDKGKKDVLIERYVLTLSHLFLQQQYKHEGKETGNKSRSPTKKRKLVRKKLQILK